MDFTKYYLYDIYISGTKNDLICFYNEKES